MAQSIKVNLPDGPVTLTPGAGEPTTYHVKDGKISVADGKVDDVLAMLPGTAITDQAATVAAKLDS